MTAERASSNRRFRRSQTAATMRLSGRPRFFNSLLRLGLNKRDPIFRHPARRQRCVPGVAANDRESSRLEKALNHAEFVHAV
jgi:hypothetical protein